MRNKAEEINNYDFTSKDILFLDTNIWLYVYGLQEPKNKLSEIYSDALKRIFEAKSLIYIDVLVISEFINSYAKMKWNILKDKQSPGLYKAFRNGVNFQPVAEEITDAINRFLPYCKQIGSGFESLPIKTMLDEYALGRSDFNDLVIASLCNARKLKLVTHDGDFKGRNIPLLTANRRLLN